MAGHTPSAGTHTNTHTHTHTPTYYSTTPLPSAPLDSMHVSLHRLSHSLPTVFGRTRFLTRYQLVGVNWMCLLREVGVNGVLADEMGLGKTVQTIAFFALLRHRRKGSAPRWG